jgi:hypothetical protein
LNCLELKHVLLPEHVQQRLPIPQAPSKNVLVTYSLMIVVMMNVSANPAVHGVVMAVVMI